MIYIIITTSIFNKIGVYNPHHRESRYIECINALTSIIGNDSNIKPIIVENNGPRPTYMDNLNCKVVYTLNNRLHFPNKGYNELLDIKQAINQCNIQDEDIIIKLTGRYKLLGTDIINCIKSNVDTHDAFIKFFNVCTLQYMQNDCVLGLFGIKCKYLKEFNYSGIKSPECEFADYVRSTIDKSRIMELTNLNLECCFADDLRILHV
jgi:hypothetical protein